MTVDRVPRGEADCGEDVVVVVTSEVGAAIIEVPAASDVDDDVEDTWFVVSSCTTGDAEFSTVVVNWNWVFFGVRSRLLVGVIVYPKAAWFRAVPPANKKKRAYFFVVIFMVALPSSIK